MILQALNDYYNRKTAAQNATLPPIGFGIEFIQWILVLDKTGRLVNIEDTSDKENKRGTGVFVPKDYEQRTSGIQPNLLWDNAEYVLAIDTKGKPEKARQKHQAFVERLAKLIAEARAKGVESTGMESIMKFYESYSLDQLESEDFQSIKDSSGNISFRLVGEPHLICQEAGLQEVIVQNIEAQAKTTDGFCLVNGENAPISILHQKVKGVWGAQTSGANIVSYNWDAADSYAKKGGNNSPVSVEATFNYTTALNYLLRKGSEQRMQVGDTTTVFWAEKNDALESDMSAFFNEPPKDDPDARIKAIKGLYKSPASGAYLESENNTRFFVLGLAPNAARIAIRFWQVGTVGEMRDNIRQYFDELKIDGYDKYGYPSLFRLLTSTATLGKSDNIPPNLAGETMRAILTGLPYPATLLQAAIRRNKAEQKVTYHRAALIKAWLNRQIRKHNINPTPFDMSLNKESSSEGYQLGRLFATLEKIQEDALGKVNAGIRDRYYASASSTPASVFPVLIRMTGHHLPKLNPGRRVNQEKLLGEIMSHLKDHFPKHLAITEQGAFAIGYYHQQQDFYTSKNDKKEQEPTKQEQS